MAIRYRRHRPQHIPVKIQRPDIDGIGSFYGEHKLKLVADEHCGVLRMFVRDKRSSVRADSSASKSKAYLATSSARLIFDENSEVLVGDHITVDGQELRVTGMFHRFGLRGRPGHFEIEAEAWVWQDAL